MSQVSQVNHWIIKILKYALKKEWNIVILKTFNNLDLEILSIEYLFIAITLRSTLTQTGATC